jgi:hypothetical protein
MLKLQLLKNFNNCSFFTNLYLTPKIVFKTVFNNDLVIAALRMAIMRRNVSG